MFRSKGKLVVGLALLVGFAGAAWAWSEAWRRQDGPPKNDAEPPNELAAAPPDKIIVSDPAQKNLNLTSKPLKAESFWKTISVPEMIVDRPGISDREIVAPAIGTVSRILHVPGDIVRPGDSLFTLKLLSESLHQTQTDLFKSSQDIKLAEARRERLIAGGQAIARAQVIEVESDIARLETATKAFRVQLRHYGLSQDDIDGVADGNLVSEIAIVTPPRESARRTVGVAGDSQSAAPPSDGRAGVYEVQELKVDLGQQVQAGQTLCHLSNHQLLAIEGRAFRDETSLLERSINAGWPVEVDFQEDADADWPPIEAKIPIRYLANTIDSVTRTFAFLLPLDNQFKAVDRGDGPQRLWRFRPGQKVRLRIRIERLDDVFVLPASAVVAVAADSFVFTQNANTAPQGSAIAACVLSRALRQNAASRTEVNSFQELTARRTPYTASARLSSARCRCRASRPPGSRSFACHHAGRNSMSVHSSTAVSS